MTAIKPMPVYHRGRKIGHVWQEGPSLWIGHLNGSRLKSYAEQEDAVAGVVADHKLTKRYKKTRRKRK